MIVKTRLKLDISSHGVTPVVDAVQNDTNSRVISADIYADAAAWNIEPGISPALAYRKPDGTHGLYNQMPDATPAVTVDGNNVEITLAPQVLTADGIVNAAIVFTEESTLNRVASFPITIRVQKDPSSGAEVSNDYYKYTTMEQVSDYIEQAEQIVSDALVNSEAAKQAAIDANDAAQNARDSVAGAADAISGAISAAESANTAADRADTVATTMESLHDEMVTARDEAVSSAASAKADAVTATNAIETTTQNAQSASTDAQTASDAADRAVAATDGKLDKEPVPVITDTTGLGQVKRKADGTLWAQGGDTGSEIDDNVTSTDSTWSSKNISDKLKMKADSTELDKKLDKAPIGTATIEDTQEVHRTSEGKLVTAPSGGGITLTANVDTGSEVTARSGTKVLKRMSVNNKAEFALPHGGKWDVNATKGEQVSDTQSVEAVDNYAVTLDYFNADLTVTAKPESVVTVKGNGKTMTEESTGTASFHLIVAGDYEVYAEYDGGKSETKTVSITQDDGQYTAEVKFATLTVTSPAGSNVVIAKGAETRQKVSTGTDVFYLPSTGVWSVTITKDGQTATKIKDCPEYQDYSVPIDFFNATLTVTVDSGSIVTATLGDTRWNSSIPYHKGWPVDSQS